jgi:hypothetical protein
MQTSQQISWDQLREVVEAIYAQGPVVVRQAYSDFSCATKEFADPEALLEDLRCEPGAAKVSRQHALYYPEAKGMPYEKRIALKPDLCGGHTFRFCQEGWGLIQFQCDFRQLPSIDCRVAVNSPTRAANWSATIPEMQNPALWDWVVVERKAGRLVRLLRKMGKSAQRKGSG